jgi:serine/threonine protein kinase
VLSGLQVAHTAGVIHRDVKPENILIAGGGSGRFNPDQVKVTDFGLGYAGTAPGVSMLQSGSLETGPVGLAGTLAYISPEQRDGGPVDGRSDLYALGIVLHEMLTGVLPQGHDLPGVLRPDTPRWLERVFERSYTRRDHRFTSAGEILLEIERFWPEVWSWGTPAEHAAPRVHQDGDRWRCMACEGTVDAADQFCIHCGRQLVARVPRCPTCHAFVGRTDNFCILCGTDMRRKA